MATKAVNAKSRTLVARVPHEIADTVEALKNPGESTGQFVTAALKREIEFREDQKENPKK